VKKTRQNKGPEAVLILIRTEFWLADRAGYWQHSGLFPLIPAPL
jgi:hypothetical protein